jgi:hypothetical protein
MRYELSARAKERLVEVVGKMKKRIVENAADCSRTDDLITEIEYLIEAEVNVKVKEEHHPGRGREGSARPRPRGVVRAVLGGCAPFSSRLI